MSEEQLDLFAARAARDEALARVDAHVEPAWRDAALAALERVAHREREFLVEEVWKELGDVAPPHEGRAMGAVIQRGRREGLIAPTDTFRASSNPLHHAVPRRVWRSLVCGAAAVA